MPSKNKDTAFLYHCWPPAWLEAAQNAGFALYEGNGRWVFVSDCMRDRLARFAKEIIEHHEQNPR